MKESLDSQASKTFPITLAIALTLGVFAAGSEELVISPLLPDLSNSFQHSLDILALSISIYGLAVLVGAPLLVPLGDRYSRELCLIIGLSFFLIGTVMCAAAPNLAVFLQAVLFLGWRPVYLCQQPMRLWVTGFLMNIEAK